MGRRKTFVEKESNFSARVKSRWRLPRGKHSKVRQMHKGRPVLPGPGYGSTEDKRWLHHPSGLKVVNISRVSELNSIDTKIEGVLIASTVGGRKKVEIVKAALEKSITLLNYKTTLLSTISSIRAKHIL